MRLTATLRPRNGSLTTLRENSELVYWTFEKKTRTDEYLTLHSLTYIFVLVTVS